MACGSKGRPVMTCLLRNRVSWNYHLSWSCWTLTVVETFIYFNGFWNAISFISESLRFKMFNFLWGGSAFSSSHLSFSTGPNENLHLQAETAIFKIFQKTRRSPEQLSFTILVEITINLIFWDGFFSASKIVSLFANFTWKRNKFNCVCVFM